MSFLMQMNHLKSDITFEFRCEQFLTNINECGTVDCTSFLNVDERTTREKRNRSDPLTNKTIITIQ